MTVTEILDTLPYGPAPESAQPALDWIAAHDGKFGIYYGGEWHPGTTHFESFNPATTLPIAQITQATAQDVDHAVKAARKGFETWQGMTATERAKILYAIAREIQKNSRLFAVLESLDNGKPIRETRDIDIPLVARHFYYHAGIAKRLDTQFPGYESVGVCGQIIPWNFPLLMLSWKIAPALAAGNTVVLKPAEYTSLTALLFAEICHSAGVPAGVVNIVTGDGATGKAIVEHPDINKIAFTGSTEVGRILRTATAGTGKKLSLELGGKSPFVIFEDADLDSAVEGLVDAIWFNQGQVCCAGSRLLIQESIADRAIRKIKARMENLRIGNPLDKAVDVGAIVAAVQLEQIDKLVKQGVSEGATLFQSSQACPTTGWFYPPTLLTDVAPASTVAQVEIFGPVLVAMTFRTPAEAVAIANNTVYGLAASVWSENLNVALDVAGKIKAGTVWVNCTNQFDASSGFGGYRESGFGREGGSEGVYEYLRAKTIPTQIAASSASFTPNPASINRTHKMYIGGKQARPDGGYSFALTATDGTQIEFAEGNRKDIHNAVEAADAAAPAWGATTTYLRSQILYYLAENLEAARGTMLNALAAFGMKPSEAIAEFEAGISEVLDAAAVADKYDGAVHSPPMRGMTYTRPEPLGPVGVICPDAHPFLGLVATICPLIAMGNTVVAIPSPTNPLPAAELYRILEASDVPSGVVNIATNSTGECTKTLAEHDTVAAIWHFGAASGDADVEQHSIGNLKQTWTGHGTMPTDHALSERLRRATQVKNIWVPFGS